jgi:hypothetical protein
VPHKYMYDHPTLGLGEGNNGFFVFKRNNIEFRIQASDLGGWEHVSVSLNKARCPDWEEMCMIKDMFWDEEDCVVQFHPPKSEYVNMHTYVLHLWRPTEFNIQTPPSIFIGVK